MPKFVYLKVRGVDQSVQIKADKVEESCLANETTLTLSNGGQKVGEFKGYCVEGWWVEDEAEKPSNS